MLRELKRTTKVLLGNGRYAATAVTTLSICMAVNIVIFAIVNSILLRPLSIGESDRIVIMSNQYPKLQIGSATFSKSAAPDYFDRLQHVDGLEEQAMYDFTSQTIEINHAAERIEGMATTPSLFRLLRVNAMLGRVFEPADGEIGSEQKVILSHGLWQQMYAGVPAVLGRELRISDRPFTIIGVMPKEFYFIDPGVRFWIPLAFTPLQKSDTARHRSAGYNIGRLKPGATIDQVQSQVNALNAANMERLPQYRELLVNAGFYSKVENLQDMLVGSVRTTLYLLWGGALLVLLIGGVNIMNLAIGRYTLRSKELATQLALGATRGHLIRELTVEGLVLTGTAAVFGLVLSFWVLGGLKTWGLDRLPRAHEIHLDVTSVAFGLALAILTGLFLGLAPVAQLLRLHIGSVLNEESRTRTGGKRATHLRRALVIVQVGLAFMLLMGSGLLLASFRNLLKVDPGFEEEEVVTAAISLPRTRYASSVELRTFTERSLEAIRSIHGVIAAGATTIIPFGGARNNRAILAEGYVMKPGESLISPSQVIVTPGYFEAMRTDLIRGRYFNDSDTPTSSPVVIVDEKLARKFWPDADPIGKRMFMPSDPQNLNKIDASTRWFSVVGVVAEVQLNSLAKGDDSFGAYYFPYAQATLPSYVYAIRSSMNPNDLIGAVRRQLASIDPGMPPFDIKTMTERTSLFLSPRRTALLLATAFACIALFLSAVGIYGVLSYLVAQRRREIGIRIALGCSTAGILRLVFKEALVLITAGLCTGLLGTLTVRRILDGQLYGIASTDPILMTAMMATLAIIGLAASVLPARSAAQVDPALTLNAE